MITGSSVKNLVVRLLHAGLPSKENVRPVVWQSGFGGPMTFTLVQADQGLVYLGQVDRVYESAEELMREIADAHVMFGVPTQARLEEAFPNARSST